MTPRRTARYSRAKTKPLYKPHWDCLDCRNDTLLKNEYYMVHNTLWAEANPQDSGMLCIECFEKRIGRRLNGADFIECKTNGKGHHSELLHSRING